MESPAASLGPAASASPPPAAADPAPQPAPLAVVSDHPPYEEMIVAAITALKSPGGSSKKAIADYIEENYPRLPHNHSAALAVHLRDLKATGRLVMARSNYRLAEQGSSSRPKRGRPAKANANPKEAAAATPSAARETRKRGRPAGASPAKKQDKGKAVVVAAPSTTDGAGSSKRSRGRPPKVNVVPFANEAAGSGALVKSEAGGSRKLPVRRRGRFPRADTAAAGPSGSGSGQAKSKKATRSAADAGSALDDHIEYEILQKKVKVMQTRIKDAAAILKPHLAGVASPAVMDAIIELEAIAALDA